jgi:hypothetical protein
MARDKTIRFLRTSLSSLNTQAGSSNLLIGEPYYVTDEDAIAIGKSTSTYILFERKRAIFIEMFDMTDDVTINKEYHFRVPEIIGTNKLITAKARVITAGTTNATTVSVYNGATNMLSSNISVSSARTNGSGTVNTSNNSVAENDLIKLKVETVSTTAPKGLVIELIFRKD